MSDDDERVQGFVFNALASFGPELDEIDREATLESLNIDSLDLTELGQLVEDEYGVRLKVNDMKDITTVGQVVDLIVSKVQ